MTAAEAGSRPTAAHTAVVAAWLLLALVLLAPPARPGVTTKELGGVRVTVDSPWPPGVLQGWLPVSVKLTNATTERRDVTAVTRQSGTGSSQATSRQRLEPGETRRTTWLVPIHGNRDTDIDVDLRVGDDRARMEISDEPGGSLQGDAFTLVALADHEVAPTTVSAGSATIIRHSALPSDWRAYTSLARLIISTTDGVPDDAALDAILAWVAAGGVLQVSGDDERLGLPLDPRFVITDGAPDPDLISLHRVGLGWIQRTRRPRSDLTPFWRSARKQASYRFERPGVLCGPLDSVVSLRGAESVPVRLLATVLVLFFLAMGPLQFWWLKKRGGRPVTLLLTTPALGFGFLTLVLVSSVWHQGLGVRQAVSSLTWLDQTRHHAATLAQRSVYSGSLFDSNLAYDVTTAATGITELADGPGVVSLHMGSGPLGLQDYRVDLDRGVLSGSYLPVRAPAAEVLARSAVGRQRLAVERDGDALFVVNGLGVEVLDLTLQDEHDEAWHLDRPLAAGERRALTRGEPFAGALAFGTETRGTVTTLDGLPRDQRMPASSTPAWPALGRLSERGVRHVLPAPRTYLALLAESPFLDDGGVERTTEHGRHLLIGDLGPLP